MIQGKIKMLDLESRKVVIAAEDGRELTMRVPDGKIIEVAEPATLGMMGGDLKDLTVGHWVRVAIDEHHADGTCTCGTLISIS
jgi:hypothetical protein